MTVFLILLYNLFCISIFFSVCLVKVTRGILQLANEDIRQGMAELEILIEKTKKAEPNIFGSNIQQNEALWDTYYNCLNKQFEVTKTFRSFPPKAIAALEGGTVRMQCLLCASPSMVRTTPEWFWFDLPLPPDDWTLIDRKTGDVSIYGVRLDEGGHYECRLGKARSVPYLLQVLSTDTEVRLVKGRHAPKGPKPMPEERLPDPTGSYPAITIFTDWSSWSQCSRCGEVGLRNRFGSCTVSLSNEVLQTTNLHGTSTITSLDTTKKRIRRKKHSSLSKRKELPTRGDAEKITTMMDKSRITSATVKRRKNTPLRSSKEINGSYLLHLFITGIPCTSFLLPEKIRHLPAVKKRKNEIMEGYCKPPCADTFFEVKDRFGKLLERANNSAGVFSALQNPPAVPPLPTRSTLFVPVYEPVTFGCPGHLHLDVPFYWTVNRTKRLIPAVVANQTNGRVTINFRQQISFKEVEPEDGRLYVCWQLDSIAGVVRLVPYDPSAVKIDHHLMLIGITVILGTFAYVFARIFFNKKRAASVS